jgi:NAD(P)-dependent dehydrogenase (short-subunit alcohol dehydrogenase family)
MIEQRSGGAIVNLSSVDGFRPSYPGFSAYGAAKGGILQLTRNLALELAPYAIRVNSIAPGSIETEGAAKAAGSAALSAADRAELAAGLIEKIPLGRVGSPRDIGTAACFLASDAASYITGTNLLVDGGLLLT